MNAFRFRPALESLDNRLMPSATAPVVAFEYLVLSAAPSPAANEVLPRYWAFGTELPAESVSGDDVVVDGKIITAENPTAADPHGKHIDVLSFHWGATQDDKNETIKVDGNRTEMPVGAGETIAGIDFRPY